MLSIAEGALLLRFSSAAGAAAGRSALLVPATAGAWWSSRAERGFFGLTVGFVLAVTAARILAASLTPVFTDDEAHQWALKAKLVWHFHGFGAGFAEALTSWPYLYNADYPPLNPLLQLQVFAAEGGIVQVANRLPIQLVSLALVLVLAAGVRRLVRPGLAALLLLLYPACDEALRQASQANGDLLLALGSLVACDAWLRWRATREAAWFRLFALALAFALWSKNEGQLHVAAMGAAWLVALLLARGGLRARLALERVHLWLLVPLAFYLSQRAFNWHFGLTSGWLANPDVEQPLPVLLAEHAQARAPAVLAFFRDRILLDPRHGALALACLFALVLCAPLRLSRGRSGALALALAVALVGYALVFLGAPHELQWHLENAAQRVTFQLVPAAILALACAWSELVREPG